MARFVTTQAGGSEVSLWAYTTTGYLAVRWWDGSVGIYGDGYNYNIILAANATPASGPWSGNSPKEFYAWSCNSATDAAQNGDITYLDLWYRNLAQADVQGLSELTSLCLGGNHLRSINLTGCTSLIGLNLTDTANLVSLDITPCTSLEYLYAGSSALSSVYLQGTPTLIEVELYNTQITNLDLTGLPNLQYLDVSDTQLAEIDLSAVPLMEGLDLTNCQLTSLDLSHCHHLRWCNAQNMALESVIATGVSGLGGKCWLAFNNNNLSATALDAFFTSLSAFTGFKSNIGVYGNPGSCTCDPGIANAKNWYVYTGC